MKNEKYFFNQLKWLVVTFIRAALLCAYHSVNCVHFHDFYRQFLISNDLIKLYFQVVYTKYFRVLTALRKQVSF